MGVGTFFGELRPKKAISNARLAAIQRGLKWCKELSDESEVWTIVPSNRGLAIERRFGNKAVMRLFPMIAAYQDCGMFEAGYSKRHLPVEIDGSRICVVAEQDAFAELHVDFVASFILLFSSDSMPPLAAIPKTVRTRLFSKLFPKDLAQTIINGGMGEDISIIWDFQNNVFNDADALALIQRYPIQRLHSILPFLTQRRHPGARALLISKGLDSTITGADSSLILWALGELHSMSISAFERRVTGFLEHPRSQVQAYAITHYVPEDYQVAWDDLSPLLESTSTDVMKAAFQRLVEFPELTESLISTCSSILERPTRHPDYAEILIWVSKHINIDALVHDYLSGCTSEEANHLLRSVFTRGDWLQGYLLSRKNCHFEKEIVAGLAAAKKNPSVNLAVLCQALVKGANGSSTLAIMSTIAEGQVEGAYALLEQHLNHDYRFLSRRAHKALASFPNHPRTRTHLEQGLNSTHPGVVRECTSILKRLNEV